MAAADSLAIRAGIATVLETLDGMGQVYTYEPDTARGRSAIVGPPEPFALVGSSYGNGLLDMTFPVTLIAGETIDRQASRTLDGWVLSATGVWQAFTANQTLGGLVDQALPVEVRAIGERPIGNEGVVFQAAEIAVRVLVRRDA